jgi:hypothetical protein
MSVSDYLTFIGLLITIFIGFYVTHWYSVRDTRTRAIKDYYIDQIRAIKGRVDSQLHKFVYGGGNARYFIKWYSGIELDIKAIDDGLRKCLDLRTRNLSDSILDAYDVITNLDSFNSCYQNNRVTLSTSDILTTSDSIAKVDNEINELINAVNQANPYVIWRSQIKKIQANYRYYKNVRHSRFALIRSIGERIEKHLFEAIFGIAFVIAIICFFPESDKEQQKLEQKLDAVVKELRGIHRDQDSISIDIDNFSHRYSPSLQNIKTFSNSSFFQADNIDSVKVTVVKGRMK